MYLHIQIIKASVDFINFKNYTKIVYTNNNRNNITSKVITRQDTQQS